MPLRRAIPGLALVWGTSLVPVLLWLLARPPADRIATWQTAAGSLSKVLGFVGLALMAWAVILAARFRVLERLFDGLDRAYRHHHVIGGTAFVLLLLHPTLLALRYASVSMPRAARLWLPTTEDWPLLLGQVALYLMIPALVATFFAGLRHVAFVRMQQLLGILVVPATLHVLLISGDTREFWPLRVYVLLLSGVAVASYVYHPLLTRLLSRRHAYVVERVRALSSDVTEVVLAPRRRLLPFVPGQFGFLSVETEELAGEAHPFSIASSPREARVRFLVKHLGDWTSALVGLKPGSLATIDGPYGTFSHRYARSRRQTWVAGGIGIAPFMAMAASLDDAPRYEVDLWYGYRGGDAVFVPELQELARTHRDLRVFPVAEETDGFITAAMLQARSPLAGREILLCGPRGMMTALHEQLLAAGVPDERIHYEDFAFQ